MLFMMMLDGCGSVRQRHFTYSYTLSKSRSISILGVLSCSLISFAVQNFLTFSIIELKLLLERSAVFNISPYSMEYTGLNPTFPIKFLISFSCARDESLRLSLGSFSEE